MTEQTVARALRTIADERPPPPLPDDLWRRGRRRRALRLAGGLAVLAALGAAVVVPLADRRPSPDLPPADPKHAVPRAVYEPMPQLRSVGESPLGPATLVLTGPVLGGDFVKGRTLVVGRDGRYRMLAGADPHEAGEGVHLSPDGRLLAVPGPVDGAGGTADAVSLVDLATGAVRPAGSGTPMGWAPDGRLVIADAASRLRLLDTASGKATPLDGAAGSASQLAFSPDGGLLALQSGPTLALVDVPTGRRFRELAVGRDRRLAGPGAWTADGRIALWEVPLACEVGCAASELVDGTWRLSLLDPGTAGTAPAGLDPVLGSRPRLLGWFADGTAVVETSRRRPSPDASRQASASSYPELGPTDVTVVGLGPGAGARDLVDLPADTHHVDIARDLIRADAFGGPPPRVTGRVGDWAAGLVQRYGPAVGAVVAIVLLATIARRWRRNRPG